MIGLVPVQNHSEESWVIAISRLEGNFKEPENPTQ